MEILAFAAVAGVTALAGWLADQRRARARNEQSRCATCAADLTDEDSGDLFLIHGCFVCASCATHAKRRTLWQFVVLTGAVVFVTGMIAAERGVVSMLTIPVGTAALMTAGAVHLMKLANRSAQGRVGDGADPAFPTLDVDA